MAKQRKSPNAASRAWKAGTPDVDHLALRSKSVLPPPLPKRSAIAAMRVSQTMRERLQLAESVDPFGTERQSK